MLFGLVTGNLDYMRSISEWGYDDVEIMGSTLLPIESDAAWHPRRRQIEDTGARVKGPLPPPPAERDYQWWSP
ncbi:MAG: hypothetical protein EPO26_19250 [Chloroflexota bacterium]|nr:MAG: hypothetical protein EPO26_19250 [Chloroflexota bacterium]